jgi:uncharacterized protein YndB with AHSA1/START domain
MKTVKGKTITVEATIKAPVEVVWECWTEPGHITNWCFASDDWHAPMAENDLKVKGKFKTRMAAKDGSAGFDFEGIYTKIEKYRTIEYNLGDERRVGISFSGDSANTKVAETFDPENENPYEMQKAGWQSILDNFRKYVELKFRAK